ncbi:Uroporphyrinogen-III synthase [uncultured Thiomicrorhabdus sp.]
MSQLSDLTLLNTRPANQASALSRLLNDNGIKVIECPTIQVQLLDKPELKSPIADYDILVFTSVNSLRGWQQYVQCEITAPQRVIAIGKATAQFGQKIGLPIETLSEQNFDSESLLAHPSMQNLSDKKILLVKGEGGRDKLLKTFSERGALVDELHIYRRLPADFCEQSWQTFTLSPHPVLLISSYDGFLALMEMLSKVSNRYETFDDSVWLFLETAIVFSQRIADKMHKAGWQQPIQVMQTQSDQGVLSALQQYIGR